MTYEQRIAVIKSWFGNDIIPRFAMPRDLDQRVVTIDIIEAINSNISSDVTPDRMDSILSTLTKDIARVAKTRTLPTTSLFVDTLVKSTQAVSKGGSTGAGYKYDPYQLTADRIRRGEPIGDHALRNEYRKKLINEYGITEKDLEPYDLYIANAAHKQ